MADKEKSQTEGYMDIIKDMGKESKKMPFCWKCACANIVPNDDGKGYNLKSCKEEAKIHNYRDAEKMCPLTNKNKVLIIINSGCAQLEYKPDNVEVEIRDYDVEGSWDEDNISCKEDADGDRYQEMVFESTELE